MAPIWMQRAICGTRSGALAASYVISGGIELPVTQPTCIAFGMAALDHLFVTTAREELSAAALSLQPRAGHLFVYKTSIKGRPEPRYRP
jgi:sugar lactone lactonase YvrE